MISVELTSQTELLENNWEFWSQHQMKMLVLIFSIMCLLHCYTVIHKETELAMEKGSMIDFFKASS
jgi:hypothetical protein